MDFQGRYKKLIISAMIAASPLVLMTVLVIFLGVSFDQIIMFFGLMVDKNSIMLFAIIVLGFAGALALSLLAILTLQMQESTLLWLDKMIEKHPDRKDFYADLKKLVG